MARLQALLNVLVILLLTACGRSGGSASLSGSALDPLDSGQLAASKSGFALKVLAESYRFGGRADFELDVQALAAETLVTVRTSARDLRCLYLALEYDNTRLHPTESVAAAWPGVSEELLHLAVLGDASAPDGRGRAWYGAVLPRLDRRTGVNGDFEVLRLRFAAGPGTPTRAASKAPSGPGSIVPDLAVDTQAGTATFSLYNSGDYNQDGRVAVTDLTPIGIHFGEAPPLPPPAPENSIQAVIDGSADGVVNVQDLTAIGINFLTRLDKYELYLGTQEDYDAADNGTATLAAVIPFAPDGTDPNISRNGDPFTVRLSYAVTAATLLNPEPPLAWVQSFADDGAGGFEAGDKGSSLVLSGTDHDPPVWTDDANPGVLGVLARDGLVTVGWGEATDAQSPPVTYRLYYAEGATLDFETAQTLDFASDVLYTDVTGLNNGTQYSFAVRAIDSAAVPNEDTNATIMSTAPQATQDLAGSYDSDTVFDAPMLLGTGNTTQLDNCAKLTFNSDLTIDGTLAAADCDLCIVVFGKLTVNGTLSLQASGPDPGGTGEDAYSIKVEAHGEVDFGPDSVVSGNGNFYLVDDPAEVVPPQEVIDDTDTDQNPELYPFNLMPEPEGEAQSPKGGSSLSGYSFDLGKLQNARTVSNTMFGPFPCNWIIRGPWGTVPTPPPGVKRIVYKIRANMGQIQFVDWSITGPKGRKGTNQNACIAVGGKGEDAFRMRIHSPRKVTFNNVTINFGDGGDGGDATTPPCCDAMATGGEGGKPGKFRFTAGEEIAVVGTMTLNPGQGGKGGLATALGDDGQDCPCTDGCNAVAIGGKGGECRFGIAIRGNVTGVGGIALGPARGGQGGDAVATGGKGGNACPCGDGCAGGDATATGGTGGAAHFGSLAGASGGGADGGPGGNATAIGGAGGNGGACNKFLPGGDGGPGGSATANGGLGVTGTGNGPLSTGLDGSGTATGGNGGNGGLGCLGGAGGDGGAAAATGLPETETPGAPGLPGPDRCPRLWCIPIPSLCPPDTIVGPEPIPDGFSGICPLLDMDTMLPVGSVPFTWDVSQEGCVSWFEGDLNVPEHILFFNTHPTLPCTLYLNFGQVQYNGEYPGILGMELGTYQCRPVMPSTGNPQIGFLNSDFIPIELIPLELISVPPPFSEPPVKNQFHSSSIDSFFDVFAAVDVPAQWEVLVSYIYIVDP